MVLHVQEYGAFFEFDRISVWPFLNPLVPLYTACITGQV